MVEGLDGAEGREDCWDALVPGLVLRVSAERKAWCAVYRIGGKKDRLAFGTYALISIHDARERAADILRKAQRGEDPICSGVMPPSTSPCCERFGTANWRRGRRASMSVCSVRPAPDRAARGAGERQAVRERARPRR